MSKKPEKPEKKPEPELSGRGRVGFHLIKFQVSRAMPKRNPKIRVGSGFGILQVFAHSNEYPLAAVKQCDDKKPNAHYIIAECETRAS